MVRNPQGMHWLLIKQSGVLATDEAPKEEGSFYQEAVLEACGNCCKGLSLIYLALAVYYAATLGPGIGWVLCLQKLAATFVYFQLSRSIRDGQLQSHQAYPLSRWMLGLILGSVAFTAWLAPGEDPSLFLSLLTLGVAMIALSWREAMVDWAIILMTWSTLEWLHPHPELNDRLLGLAVTLVIAVVSLRIRIGAFTRLYRLTRRDLEARELLEQRVAERSAELLKASEEKSELQQRLWQTQKAEALCRMAGGVSHDFNNLLTIVLTNLEMATEATQDPEVVQRLEDAQLASQRAAELTRQLLASSRKQKLRSQRVDLVNLLRESRGWMQSTLGESIAIDYDLGPGLAEVMADPEQLQQVLMNLVVNAHEAMPEGGKLDIGLRAHGEGFEIWLRDNGRGIEPKHLDKVLEPFFSTKSLGQGTGLGLSVVDGIVSQLGGRIELESEADRGTTVRLFLPATTRAAEPAPRSESQHEKGQGEMLLVVDDEPQLLRLVSSSLKRAGYDVLAAPDAESAIRLLEETGAQPVLLVTDVVMPGMDGPSLARHLLAQRPQLKVLFMSGYADDRLGEFGLDPTGKNFLAKPYSQSDLLSRIQDILKQPD